MIEVEEVGPEQAEEVLRAIRAGFGARELLDPPSSATSETLDSVEAALHDHGGLLAIAEAGPVGTLLFEPLGSMLGLRRVAVRPDDQGRGVARSMIRRAEAVAQARGYDGVRLHARAELPRTVRMWQQLGYAEADRAGTLLSFAKVFPVEVTAATAEDARTVGLRLAPLLRAGDLVILSGGLGAGKTTFTQGLGAGLRVRGQVTSPTFVISRVHPSLTEGPALVHVDAYRLGGLAELDDLDLDTSLDSAVTVVEWGSDVAEGLAEDRLEVEIVRARVDEAPGPDEDDPRTLRLTAVGARWVGAGLRRAVTAAGAAHGTA